MFERLGISKVFAITIDNANSNHTCIQLLKDGLSSRWCDFFGGRYMHMRFITHIINLIVNDGLLHMKVSIKRVRKAVRFVTSSPAGIVKFKECIELKKTLLVNLCCV